ncbi:MAG: hypothetical protein D8M61_09000 [Ignavibacteriae bacterium]|nr:hypothetical protein [Ignavibacteriota bacterium]
MASLEEMISLESIGAPTLKKQKNVKTIMNNELRILNSELQKSVIPATGRQVCHLPPAFRQAGSFFLLCFLEFVFLNLFFGICSFELVLWNLFFEVYHLLLLIFI